MSQALRTVLLAVAAIFVAMLWLRFVHDPAVRARAALHARDAVADSLVRAFRERVSVMRAQDSVRIDSLASEAARLRRRGTVVRTVTDTVIEQVEDTALREQLRAALARERAVRDSVQRADSLRIVLLEGALRSRDALLREAGVVIDSLEALRDAWRTQARRSPFGIGCALGPAVSTSSVAPLGVACGVVLRL